MYIIAKFCDRKKPHIHPFTMCKWPNKNCFIIWTTSGLITQSAFTSAKETFLLKCVYFYFALLLCWQNMSWWHIHREPITARSCPYSERSIKCSQICQRSCDKRKPRMHLFFMHKRPYFFTHRIWADGISIGIQSECALAYIRNVLLNIPKYANLVVTRGNLVSTCSLCVNGPIFATGIRTLISQ